MRHWRYNIVDGQTEARCVFQEQAEALALPVKDHNILIPCPQCGAELEMSTKQLSEFATKPVAFSRGHVTILRTGNLRNPIQRPTWEIPRELLEYFCGACFFLALAVWGLGAAVGYRRIVEIAPFLLLGAFLVPVCIMLLLGAASVLFDVLWRYTRRGRLHRRYERSLAMVKDLLRPAEKAVLAAEQQRADERGRQRVAERAARRDYLLRMSPRKFEEHVGQLFAALGYDVRVTPISSDEGVDAYLAKDGRQAIVQCKHYTTGKVSRPEIQRIFGVLNHKRADEAFFVATVEFSRQAQEFARGKPIRLIDLDMLLEMAPGAFSEEFIRRGPTGKMTLPRRRYWRS